MTDSTKVYTKPELAAYFCGDNATKYAGMNEPTVTQFIEWNNDYDIALDKAGLDDTIPAGVWFTPINDDGVKEWIVTDESGAVNHYKKAGIKS